MKAIAMVGQQVATVVGDLVVDVANAIRNAEKQSLLEAAQGAMQPHALRLKQVTGRIGADTMQWMRQGGIWRSILVMAVGGVSVTILAGLTAFLMTGLVATVNAVVIAFLMCLLVAGSVLSMFSKSLTCIYIGGLAVTVVAIGWAVTAVAIGCAVVMASSTVLFFAGWIFFGWEIWEVMNKSLNFVRGVIFRGCSVSAPRAPRHAHLRERGPSSLGGFTTQSSQG